MFSTDLTGKAGRRTTIRHPSFNIQPVYQFLVYFTTDSPGYINLVFCSGALYTYDLVISAANCIYNFIEDEFSDVLVELANTHMSETCVSEYRTIVRAAIYPGYITDNPSRGIDLALIKVSIVPSFLNLH